MTPFFLLRWDGHMEVVSISLNTVSFFPKGWTAVTVTNTYRCSFTLCSKCFIYIPEFFSSGDQVILINNLLIIKSNNWLPCQRSMIERVLWVGYEFPGMIVIYPSSGYDWCHLGAMILGPEILVETPRTVWMTIS